MYSAEEAESLTNKFKPDIVQLPLNAFDQRADRQGTLKKLKSQGVEIHIRSVFLQGLLLMKPENINDYFMPWRGVIKTWNKFCEDRNWTPLEAALKYVYQHPEIDKYIVGISTMNQLVEINEIVKNIKGKSDMREIAHRFGKSTPLNGT